jgi:hypothetical protein
MPLPLTTSISNFHLQHYNHLFAYWGIYPCIPLFTHVLSPLGFLLSIVSLDTLVRSFNETLTPSQ